MRASPFNKASGKARPAAAAAVVDSESDDGPGSDSDIENDASAVGRRAAPRRGATAATKTYVDMLSDNESEDEESAAEESDFELSD